MTDNMPMIQVLGATKRFNKAVPVTVFENLSLEIADGEFLAMMGPSGSGKSTLLHAIGGIERIDAGEIRVGSRRIDNASERELTRWRAEAVSFVFQFYNLIPVLNAQQNIELPLLLTRLSAAERRCRADQALDLVNLAERRRHRPSELSGGEQQRVAIARAIVSDPALILCDEPTGDLDRGSTREILSILQTLNGELKKTIVMVTHDPHAATYASRIVTLDKGELVAHGAAS